MTAWCPPVPQHWPVHRADALFTLVSGSTPKTTVPENWGGEIAWVTPDDQQRGTVDTLFHGRRNITQTGLDSCSTTLVPAGSVLLSSRAPIGYVSIAGQPLCTNQGFKTFVPNDGVNVVPQFLMWWLRHNRQRIVALGSGTTFQELSKRAAAAIPVPLPPLAEQQAIVETIERMLSVLDNIDGAMHAAQRRAAVTQRSVANRVADHQEMLPLKDLLSEGLRNGKSVKDGAGVRVLRLGALRGRAIDLTNSKSGAWGSSDPTPFLVKRGDFLVSRGNGTLGLVGRGGIVSWNPPLVAFPDTMIRIRPAVTRIDPDYLRLVWDSDIVRKQIEAAAQTTAGIFKINQTMLERLQVPVPGLEQQRTSADWGNRALTLLAHLEVTLESSVNRSAALRRSILKAAFEGRLKAAGGEARLVDEALEEIA